MTSAPLGLLIGLAALAGVSLGTTGVVLTVLVTLGFCLLDAADGDVATKPIMIASIVVIGVSVFGSLRSADAETLDRRMLDASSVVVVVRSMPQPGAQFDLALVTVETIVSDQDERWSTSQPVLAFIPVSTRANVGDRVWLGGTFSPLDFLEPGFRSYVSSRGAVGVFRGYVAEIDTHGHSPLRWLVDVRRDLAAQMRNAIPGDAGELATGIVTGDDSGLSGEADEAFRTVGLSHLTAVSGQNIAMLAGLFVLLLRGGSSRRAIMVQMATLVVVWLYVGMTGFGAPAIRAGCFLTLGFVAIRAGRRPDYLTIVALVSGGMLLVEPAYARSVSFWLSMAASAALVTAFGWPTGGVRRWMIRAVAALITAQLATVPIVVAVFGMWSVGSIPANLIVAPLMELAFPLCFGVALALYGVPFIVPILAGMAGMLLSATLAVARELAARFPAQDLAAGGILVVLAMTIPCLLMIGLLSEDARRWWSRRIGAIANAGPELMLLSVGLTLGSIVMFVAYRMI